MAATVIKKISVYHIEFPLNKPCRISGGRVVDTKIDSTIVSIETNDGIVGWGEGCPWGTRYLPAFAGGLRAGLHELCPVLIGQNPLELDKINHLMDATLSGHWYIKSALDIACWDLLGKYTRQPLHTLLGGFFGKNIVFQQAIYTGLPEDMVRQVQTARKEGYTYFSAKIGGNVALDIERVRALSADLKPHEHLIFDANRSWLPGQAIQVMNANKDLPFFFEQPCETLEECRTVRRFTTHPMILDECILSFQDLLMAYREGIAQGLGLKIGRIGGLTKTRKMRDFGVATGMRMNIAETGGSQIANAANIHIAISTPETNRHATIDFVPMHATVTATDQHQWSVGKAAPSNDYGLGITPNLAVLKEPVTFYS